MTPEEMKETARRWILGIFDNADYGLIQEMTTEKYAFEMPRPGVIPKDTLPDLIEGFRASIPDLHNVIHHQLVDGDTVVTRGTTHGTNTGPLGEIPASGNPITSDWVIFTRFEGDKIAEDWEIWDEMGVMMQMGAVSGGDS
ncbi:MAG: SnoaL-like domain-containing protein [Gemmatimonadetes bacterium]|nr:SnoaL-like domain-containing protein [Gemmatimonadota bacterium]